MTIELTPATREALDHDADLIRAVQVLEAGGFTVGLHHYAADDLRFFIDTDDFSADHLDEEDFLTTAEFLKVVERLEAKQAVSDADAVEAEVAKTLAARQGSEAA